MLNIINLNNKNINENYRKVFFLFTQELREKYMCVSSPWKKIKSIQK